MAVGRAIPISVSMLLVQVGDVGRCCRLGKMLLVEDAAELAKTKASEIKKPLASVCRDDSRDHTLLPRNPGPDSSARPRPRCPRSSARASFPNAPASSATRLHCDWLWFVLCPLPGFWLQDDIQPSLRCRLESSSGHLWRWLGCRKSRLAKHGLV